MDDYFFTPSFETKPPSLREHNILDVQPDVPEPASRGRESKRKRQEREREEEEEKERAALIVVGYESKLFRDDETSLSVNQGRFLVPWMGDKSLLMDRYDVRLLLDDRKLFKKDKSKKSKRVLSKEEAEEEAMCDYERYFDLEHYEEELEKGIPFKTTNIFLHAYFSAALLYCFFFLLVDSANSSRSTLDPQVQPLPISLIRVGSSLTSFSHCYF